MNKGDNRNLIIKTLNRFNDVLALAFDLLTDQERKNVTVERYRQLCRDYVSLLVETEQGLRDDRDTGVRKSLLEEAQMMSEALNHSEIPNPFPRQGHPLYSTQTGMTPK